MQERRNKTLELDVKMEYDEKMDHAVYAYGFDGVRRRAWLSFSSKIAYLTLDRRHKIYVNGAPVEGEFLRNGFAAILTRRDPGNVHSFQLFFAGDVDFTGNIGFVGDCHEWVAPHLPILIQTRSYPPCDVEMKNEHALGLVQLASSMQFVTKSGSTISIVRH